MSQADEPAGDDVDLGGPEAEALLGPAAELAIELARAGARLSPPHDIPRSLRPLLGHAKLTRAALATARRVVDADPAFRAKVAAAVAMPGAADLVGPAGVLWLTRPEGWEDQLAGLVAEARSATATRAERADERSAVRRLRHAEAARERAERAAAEAVGAAEAARLELAEERRLRRRGDEEAAQARRRAGSLEEQLGAARRQAAVAASRSAERAEAATSAVAARAAAEAELERLREEVAGPADPQGATRPPGPATAAEAPAAPEAPVTPPDPNAPAAPPAPAPSTPPTPAAAATPGVDLSDVSEAVAAASSSALALSEALGRAARALQATDRDPDPDPREGLAAGGGGTRLPVGGAPVARLATRPRWARTGRRATGRRPARLPPLLLEDSPEAAEHLVGLPGVVVLVDGYNTTLSAWPELPLAEQRLRLVDALHELASRTGARAEVIFDGDEVGPQLRTRTGPRSMVRVGFTASDVEADDILITRAAALPLPVVVASDDRRVREGARSAGANVLGVGQLLAVLHRKPS